MNIGININLPLSLTLLFVLALLVQCNNKGDMSYLRWDIRAEPQNDSINLHFTLVTNQESKVLLNWESLSIVDPPFEDSKLLKHHGLNEVVSKISHPQFVVENKNGETRFFSDWDLFEGESIKMKSIFSLESDIDTIQTQPEMKLPVKNISIGVNRLKIKETDETVRLHYLYYPNAEEKALGFEAVIVTSNWFNLH